MSDSELAALLIYWRKFLAPSNEVLAVEIIERLQRELAAANAALLAVPIGAQAISDVYKLNDFLEGWAIHHAAAIEQAEKARGK